jgi:hypothetical protein
MSTIYGTFPLVVPGITESVSIYGLRKKSGTILFKVGQESAARTLSATFGAVFPDPQIRTTDTGLRELTFDAYTNANTTTTTTGAEVLNLSKSFEGTDANGVYYSWTVTEIWLSDSVTERRVLVASLSSATLSPPSVTLSRRLLRRIVTGRRAPNGANSLTVTWATLVSNVTRRNFGELDEVDIVTSLSATIA